MDERIERINRRKVRFIDDPLYHQHDAAEIIEQIASQEELPAGANREELRVPRDLPPYLQDLYRTPLLTPARERALFLRFNFHKCHFVHARRRLEPQFAKARDLNMLEGYLRQATETKNAIVRANLRLVCQRRRKHLRPGLNLMELISDGNLTLIRAVDGFDIQPWPPPEHVRDVGTDEGIRPERASHAERGAKCRLWRGAAARIFPIRAARRG